MKNKILADIMALCLVSGIIPDSISPAITAEATTEKLKYKYLNYQILTDANGKEEITITGCDTAAVNVEVPAEINGIPVTSIGGKAFYDKDNIKTIVLPEGLKSIEKEAFSISSSITSIVIPESVTSICENTFAYTNLQLITILNPECDIYYSSNTLYNSMIFGYFNSTALEYANAYGKKYHTFGDTNDDNLIDSADATNVLIEYAAMSTKESKSTLTIAQKKVADVNNDGFVDATDATIILGYYAEISTGSTIGLYDFIKKLDNQ